MVMCCYEPEKVDILPCLSEVARLYMPAKMKTKTSLVEKQVIRPEKKFVHDLTIIAPGLMYSGIRRRRQHNWRQYNKRFPDMA